MDDEPRSSMPSAPARLSRALGSRIQVKHYLGWFRALDLSRAPALTPPAMLALAVGV
jgi:hypothetical protein